MIEFIPLEYYKYVWYNTLLVLVFIFFIQSRQYDLEDRRNTSFKQALGMLILILSTLFIGLRPVSGKYFKDMRTYAQVFQSYQWGEEVREDKDIYFEYFMKFSSSVMDVHGFFLMCAIIYMVPIYIVCRKFFKQYWFYAFLIMIGSFPFYGAGTNGIRNGMATSIVLLALAFSERKLIMSALFMIAVACHKSTLLPVGAYICSYFYNDSRKYLYFWLACIPISLVAGGAFEAFFTSSGIFEDGRLSYFDDEGEFETGTSFRWDFILFSATAVYAGWYFIIKKKYEDELYKHILNMYLIANGFWILVIRAGFSNRFAYLSWFMMGLVIIYPFLKMKFSHRQHEMIGNILVLYVMFTYFMNVILVG
jgi:hypothetical protein